MKVKDIMKELFMYDSNAEIILFKEDISISGEKYAVECKRLEIVKNGNVVQLFMR